MPTKINNKSPLEKEGRIGSVLGGIAGGVGGFFIGGPAGAKVGYMAGSQIGRTAGQAIDEKQREKGTGPYKEGGRLEHESLANVNQELEQPTYRTNIDPTTGEEIPFTMTGDMKPLKMLTGVSSPMTYKMSAAQYKSAVKMSEISGAAPLQSNAFYASLNAAKEKGSDTFDVGGKTFNVK